MGNAKECGEVAANELARAPLPRPALLKFLLAMLNSTVARSGEDFATVGRNRRTHKVSVK
jgi:hypothetical protein